MISIRCCLIGALAVSASALAVISPAQAAHPKKKHPAAEAPAAPATPAASSLGKFDAWTAYASQDKTGKVCYLVGQPQKSESAGSGRKPPTAMVTHRPVEKIANVVSFVEGYSLKEGSEVVLDVGGSKFELFTKDDSAWARTSDLDKTIVNALAKGKQAVVKGVPQKGPATTDIYPLAGFAKALALIDKACGVKR
jgi:Invasion associated locus B (IalB) protein